MVDHARMRWKGRFEFVFTTFGYTIGLGNIWRFPERCYRNGGGAFLFPYLLAVFFCTVPMMFLEMCLGQFASKGPIKIWSISPIFVGVGWAIWFELFITSLYYITPIMYALYYMLVSFVNIGGTLPWQQCRSVDEWSTGNCLAGNTSAEEEYWNRFVLVSHESEGMHDLGSVVLRNLCLLLVMWIIVYYCCIRGIRSIAKVIYVTATFPFGIIIILLVRGVTLSGHEEGLRFYLQADWSTMSDMNIWSSAANQALYSLGIAYGCHIALSSHNRFNNNVFRDAIIIGVANTLTSFLLGLIVFSFLGHASYKLKIPIKDMIDHGPGLLFISYIQGITQLPESPIWCVLFFLMVFTLGLDSLFVQVWVNVACIQETFPNLRKRYKHAILAGFCGLSFLLGIPLVTKGGIHMIVLIDRYVADMGLATLMVIESVAVCWLYGINNFIRDVEMMIGHKSKYFWWYWKATWMVSAPLFGVFTFIASCVSYKPSSYRGKEIPPGGEAIGWLIIVTPLLIVVVFAVIQVRRYKGLKAAIHASDDWDTKRRDNGFDGSIHINTRNWRNANQGFDNETSIPKSSTSYTSDEVFDLPKDDVISLHVEDSSNSRCNIDPCRNSGVQSSAQNTYSTNPSDSWCTTSGSIGLSSVNSDFDVTLNESSEQDPPPTPHAVSPRVHPLSDNKDYITPIPNETDSSNQTSNSSYITAVSKRPAPDIPVAPACPSSTATETEEETGPVCAILDTVLSNDQSMV